MLRFFMTGLAGALLALGLAASAAAQVNIGFGGVAYDSRQPVEVTADSLTIDQATGEAVFSGNVIVHQGDLRMAAGGSGCSTAKPTDAAPWIRSWPPAASS
jgi:lipopolysaccharide export system protein LptA